MAGDWVPVANGAINARVNVRKADKLLVDILVEEPTKDASHTWVRVADIHAIREELRLAGIALTQGLKGRGGSTASTKKSSSGSRRVVK